MATKKTAAPTVAQAIEATTAQAFATIEAAEQTAPEGVETIEQDDDEDPAAAYTVHWHIKAEGRHYAPGDTAHLTPETAAPFLASGAITEAAS